MSKPTKSLTDSKKDGSIPPGSLTKPYGSPEILTHMRCLEAKEWVKRYRAKAAEFGAASANEWWRKTIADIERIRGLDAAIELRNLMNLERKK